MCRTPASMPPICRRRRNWRSPAAVCRSAAASAIASSSPTAISSRRCRAAALSRAADLVVCNPPISRRPRSGPCRRRSPAPSRASFDGGAFELNIVRRLTKGSAGLPPKPGGWLCFEIGKGQGPIGRRRCARRRLSRAGDRRRRGRRHPRAGGEALLKRRQAVRQARRRPAAERSGKRSMNENAGEHRQREAASVTLQQQRDTPVINAVARRRA